MNKSWISFDSPGRICLLGDHNDWVGNCSLAFATDLTIKFSIKKREDNKIKVLSKTNHAYFSKSYDLGEVSRDELKYVTAVAKVLLNNGYNIGGLTLSLESNLPMKKGLSSSAALCVGTARAYNEVYSLNLNKKELAEIAYQAEHDVLSIGCGKMDQICSAYGGIIYIEFSPINIERIFTTSPLFFVVAETGGNRNTKNILNTLNNYYFNKKDPKLIYAFKEITRITKEGKTAILNGDASYLGSLMNQNQKIYDEYLKSFCKELDSERLSFLIKKALDFGALGAKWTGDGGNGALIVLSKDKKNQKEIYDVMTKLNANPIEITIFPGK